MSDNASESEQKQQMEKIFISADVWYGVFAFLCPFELGQIMALISDRLDVLVDVHFKSRKWPLGRLYIHRAIDGNGAQIFVKSSGERQPIPEGPLPDNVIDFKRIQISYIDRSVIEFLQCIRRLFDSTGINVEIVTTPFNQSRSWEIIWQNIWPLVNDNICGFLLLPSKFNHFRQFSPAVLRNCAKLRTIDSRGLFPEFPAEDNANASYSQAVAKWLLTPRGDGLPKMLYCRYCLAQMDGLKGSFVNASEPVNFIMSFCFDDEDFVPFELKNNLTGEQLTVRQIDKYKWLLVRCPIGREEDKWAKWEKKAIGWKWRRQWNRIGITFKDGDIGDGMVDEKAGPSEPKKPKN
ncbi:hypothetical protein GPALN_003240 [Globodera pallida]|nr:hypothetical protein GPALN_003240 [Globodera pallida]